MRISGVMPFLLLLIIILAAFAWACDSEDAPQQYPSGKQTETTVTRTTSTPAEPPECEEDRIAIQKALDAYHAANGTWPTANGKPGLIEWAKLIPNFLEDEPGTIKCKWQVSSDPVGKVCQTAHC